MFQTRRAVKCEKRNQAISMGVLGIDIYRFSVGFSFLAGLVDMKKKEPPEMGGFKQQLEALIFIIFIILLIALFKML